MHADKLVQGQYIAAVEFDGREPMGTIDSVKLVEMEDEKKGTINKGVVFFREWKRGFVLNRTNVELLKALLGVETQAWIGKRITLHAQIVQVGPEKKPGIRIKGSPDLKAPLNVTVKLPRKKPIIVRLVPTGKGAPPPMDEPAQDQGHDPGNDDPAVA